MVQSSRILSRRTRKKSCGSCRQKWLFEVTNSFPDHSIAGRDTQRKTRFSFHHDQRRWRLGRLLQHRLRLGLGCTRSMAESLHQSVFKAVEFDFAIVQFSTLVPIPQIPFCNHVSLALLFLRHQSAQDLSTVNSRCTRSMWRWE
jgi:hypothetical protein